MNYLDKHNAHQPAQHSVAAYIGRLLLLLTAFAIRVYHLDHFSFWIDEALTPLRAANGWFDLFRNVIYIQEAVSYDTHPPFYYMLIHLTRPLLGESDFAYRFPSVLAGMLLVALLFRFGRSIDSTKSGWSIAWTAGLIAAVNPLQVWYAQEARMYTLFVLEGLILQWILWRAIQALILTPNQQEIIPLKTVARYLIPYTIAAGITTYTQYTAVFLIGMHGLIWIWLLGRVGYRRWIWAAAGVGGLAAIPLVPYTIPRLFTGAESGFSYRSPLIVFADLVGGFSMGVTAPPPAWLNSTLWWIYLFILLASVWVWWQQRQKNRLRADLIFALLTFSMIAPAIGINIVSLLKPVYQGVRHIMLGSSAFMLLIAWTLNGLWHQMPRRPLSQTAALIGGAAVAVGSIGALWSLYTDPIVAKDNIREIVTYIEEQAGQNDVVVYNDAILMLVHWHYATRDDLIVTAAPVYPYMARAETPQILADLAQNHTRMWFVPPLPGDGRDPDEAVRGWVRGRLPLISERWFFARSAELKVEGYLTNAQPITNEIDQSASVVWQNLPQPQKTIVTEITESQMWIDIWWQGAQPPADTRLRFNLIGPDNWIWLEESQHLTLQQTNGWQEDGMHLSYRLPLPAGLPAGEYSLRMTGWEEESQQQLESWYPLGSVTISKQTLRSQTAAQPLVIFDNGLRLQSLEPADREVRPGHILPINSVWHVQDTINADQLALNVQMFSADDQLVLEQTIRPGPEWLSEWAAGTAQAGHPALTIPAVLPAGNYDLRWRLLSAEEPVEGRAKGRLFAREWNSVTTINVVEWPLQTELPTIENRTDAQFGQHIQLHGYNLAMLDSREDMDKLTVELIWQAMAAPDQNMFVFVHLLDQATGTIVRQSDWIPANGDRPTSGWRPSEVIIDTHQLDIKDLPGGQYQLLVGMYSKQGDLFERPAVVQNGREIPERQAILQEVTLP